VKVDELVPDREPVIVLLSGGQDSTVALYWAKHHFSADDYQLHALSFFYGQRHASELEAGRKIAKLAGVRRDIIDARTALSWSGSALVDRSRELTKARDGEVPSSFVPGRNLLFLTLAAAFGFELSQSPINLVIGASQVDFSGYPDCREGFMRSAAQTLTHAMGQVVRVHTPLMHMSKAQEVRAARQLPGCWEALALTVTCYEGTPACGLCPACELRAQGFDDAGEIDPAQVPREAT